MRAVAFGWWLALLPQLALAEVWEDPDLAQALIEAEAVVRVRVPAASQGQPRVRVEVERVLKGELEPGAALDVGGLHDPTRIAGPTFAAGDALYLILRRAKDGWAVPTPTFGRYPLRDGVVKYATLRDTYLRIDLPEDDWVRYLRLHLEGRADAGWLQGLREHLARGGPGDTGPARARHYLALEVLALRGEPDDAEVIAAYQLHDGPFQLRVSACRALHHALGARAATNLLASAGKDPEPAVRSLATQLLAELRPAPPGLVQQLVRIYPQASADAVRFAGINDPRTNTWPSPRLALIRAFRALGPAPAKDALLDTLDDVGPAEAEALVQTLGAIEGDPRLPGQLVDRFRDPGPEGSAVNRLICAVLRRVTGQTFGDDPDAWLGWVAEQE